MNSLPQNQAGSPRPKQNFKGIGYLIGGSVLWILLFVAFGGEPSWNVGQRLFYSFIATLAILATVWVAIKGNFGQSVDKSSSKPRSAKDALAKLPLVGFVPTQSYLTRASSGIVGVVLDENTGNICFLQKQGRFIDTQIIAPTEILESEVVEDGFSITKTSTTNMAGRLIVGGLLLGPLGAIVGGVTAKKSQTNKVKSVDLRIIVNDTAKPVCTVNFMAMEQKRGSFIHKTALEQANHWHALVSVLIRRASAT